MRSNFPEWNYISKKPRLRYSAYSATPATPHGWPPGLEESTGAMGVLRWYGRLRARAHGLVGHGQVAIAPWCRLLASPPEAGTDARHHVKVVCFRRTCMVRAFPRGQRGFHPYGLFVHRCTKRNSCKFPTLHAGHVAVVLWPCVCPRPSLVTSLGGPPVSAGRWLIKLLSRHSMCGARGPRAAAEASCVRPCQPVLLAMATVERSHGAALPSRHRCEALAMGIAVWWNGRCRSAAQCPPGLVLF